MPLYRLTPPGDVVDADLVRDEGSTVALMGTALVMNQPRDIVVRRVPVTVLIEEVSGPPSSSTWVAIRPRATTSRAPRRLPSWRPGSTRARTLASPLPSEPDRTK